MVGTFLIPKTVFEYLVLIYIQIDIIDIFIQYINMYIGK